jgi:hypothetical protein
MHNHARLHLRRARSAFAFPDPKAIASAIAAPFTDPDAQPRPAKTVTQKVYTTMPATFDGPTGGMSTIIEAPTETLIVTDSTPASVTPQAAAVSSTTTPIVVQASRSSSTLLETASVPSSLIMAISTSTNNPSLSSSSAISPTAFPASQDTDTSSSSSSDDMSVGAKAGIALGIILLVGVIASLLLFCLRQRRKAAGREPLDDEKFSEVDAFANKVPSIRSVRTASTAPRLSLRPVTQFQPNLSANRNTGIAMSAVSPVTVASQSAERLTPQSAWERPETSNSQYNVNPFNSPAEVIDAVNAAGPLIVDGVSHAGDIITTTTPDTNTTGAAAGAAAGTATAATIGLVRTASKLGNGPKPLDLTKKPKSPGLPSPALTEFSVSEAPSTPVPTAGAAAIAAAGGPQNSPVYRVQLDFNPSMDDELPLRAGQLVRLLHEYDDGWVSHSRVRLFLTNNFQALCIRLDRSAQGVVPRTCLSVRPVKPRPQQPRGPPPAALRPGQPPQQSRPASPAMNMGYRSASPAGGRPPMGGPGPQYNVPQGRPMTPTGRPQYGPQVRSTTPTGTRSRSPSPQQPQSPAQQSRRNSPLSTSPVASDGSGSPPNSVSRKPVPGQAL